jgi:gliding motility-associated protein GldL
MNIGELLKTKRAKSLMGFVYSWGASVVLIGALFKLQHWPFSGWFLGIGLITEAVIFFISAFEPPLEMPEWSRVYPELKEDFGGGDFEALEKPGKNRLNELLGGSEITPALLDKVSFSLNELSNTAQGISDISSATLATENYVKNLGTASEAMNTFSEVNTKAHHSIHSSVSQLVDSYKNTTVQMTNSGQAIIEKLNKTGDEFTSRMNESGTLLVKSYRTASEKIEQSMQQFGDTSGNYAENLGKLNKNLSSLNYAVETQLKGSEEQFKMNQKYGADMGRINEMLANSAEELKKYQENAAKMNQHLEALNKIYGNMLGAMNYKK